MKATEFKNAEQFKKAIKNNRVKLILKVSLSDLVNCEGFEGLNELADQVIYRTPGVFAFLVDLSYKIVGHFNEKQRYLSGECNITGVFIECDAALEELTFDGEKNENQNL